MRARETGGFQSRTPKEVCIFKTRLAPRRGDADNSGVLSTTGEESATQLRDERRKLLIRLTLVSKEHITRDTANPFRATYILFVFRKTKYHFFHFSSILKHKYKRLSKISETSPVS